MGLITAAILGGVSLAAKGVSTYQANKQAEYTNRLNMISNDIQKYTMFENAALQQEQMQTDFIAQEGTADAVATAQNRRGASVDAISTERKRMLDKNVTQVKKNAETAGIMYDLDSASGTAATDASNQARNISLFGDAMSYGSKIV